MMQNGYSAEGLADRYRTDMEQITREYGMMAKLKGNANVVYCDDLYCEQSENGIGGIIYIKMELLKPLNETLGNPISQRETVKLGMDLCKALAECKTHNVLHRDIKPGNIMVAKDGNYKLGDFGVAKTAGNIASGTKTGTYSYMAPEVYNNQPYGLSVDIYSLGMVMYWMLNARCGPFLPLPPTVPSAMQLDEATQRRFGGEQLPPPAGGCPELQRIVLKACAFDPAQRYQSPDELYADLLQLSKNLPDETPQPKTYIPVQPIGDAPTVGNSWEVEKPVVPNIRWEDIDHTHPTPPKDITIVEEENTEENTQNVKVKSKALLLFLTIWPYTGLFGFHDLYLGDRKKFYRKFTSLNYLVFGWFYDIAMVLLNKYKILDNVILK